MVQHLGHKFFYKYLLLLFLHLLKLTQTNRLIEIYQNIQKFSEPNLNLILNGGINSVDHARKELNSNQFDPDGIMMGRAAYTDPYMLTNVDHVFYKNKN